MSSVDATTETPADIRPSTAIRDPLADYLISPQNSAQEITNWYFTEVLKVTDSVGIAEAELPVRRRLSRSPLGGQLRP